jgi:hypothetical protein
MFRVKTFEADTAFSRPCLSLMRETGLSAFWILDFGFWIEEK